ncbi:hypothetical protein [Janthinobacterium sp. BJB446]|uniref:hypothetical protein n=1 Tax=unclassified Janthinobacterium TaxID=2610881 RepID=UPI000C0EC43A|nr:hypothetical protein [Janthinobacterium sp. BJB446]PHV21344.1 hypothetical protein CSQ92_18520 [Janthinobacterium sp. BJB446]
MTALIQLLPTKTASPQEQASRIFSLIKKLEDTAKKAGLEVSEIESRGWWKNIVSSSRDDLISTARSQGEINDLLVKLNQEIIGLNTLGFAYLTSVIAEFERQVNEGVKDSDGRIHVLSENGKNVAKAAKAMFSAILDASRETQGRIDANTEAAIALRLDVDKLSEFVSCSIKNIDNRFEEATRQATEQSAGNLRALQNLEHRVGDVTEIAASFDARTRAVEKLTGNARVRIAEQLALAETHSTKINEAMDSVHTLIQGQTDASAKLNLLAHKGMELEKQLPSLLAQIDLLRDNHAAEKDRLQRTTRTMSVVIFFLALICTGLALREFHIL